MPTKTPAKMFAAALAAAALLALPAAANAELAFVKGSAKPAVFQANNDGSGIHKIGYGRAPKVSPNGKFIAYEAETASHKPLLNIAPVAGGKVTTLATGLRESFQMRWSPDSEMFAAIEGNELGKRRLVLFDLAAEEERTIATGYFNGVTFSPDGSELAYGLATSETFPQKSDIYRVSTGEGEPKAITSDHNSSSPLWSSQGEIAFVKELGAKTRKYAPKNEIYLMDRQGRNVRRLTHTTVSQLSTGLLPTAWSENGARLLTQFGGQDITYAVTVNPKTGAQKPLVEETEQGFIGAALSKNGQVVLGTEGGFEPGPNKFVGTIPYGGGKARVLVRNAYEPSWNR
jgi:Tol biopolymer transport system component